MQYVKKIPARKLVPGDYLEDEDKFVIEVSYTRSNVIIKCAHEMRSYPSMSLILDHDEMVTISSVEYW